MTVRIGMIGPGGMGQAHIERIHTVIAGGRVVAVSDVDPARAAEVAERIGGVSFATSAELIESPDVDAVMICSFGPAHEVDVLACIAAGKPVLCEKPLTPTAAAALRIMEAEQAAGRRLVTVGFMRRFDASYREMKDLLDSGELGETLMVHCAHRNPTVPENYTWDMAINDTAIHEVDTMRWLLGEEFVSARVDTPKKTSLRFPHLQDPLVLILTSASGVRVDDEIFVNCQFGYDIRCEAVAERGAVSLGDQELTSVRTELPRPATSSPATTTTASAAPSSPRSRSGSRRSRAVSTPARPHGTATPPRASATPASRPSPRTVRSPSR